RLRGVTGGLLMGERGSRRLSLAGGNESDWGHSLLAFETRETPGLTARAGDERLSMLGTGGVMIGKDLAVDLLVRFYRDTWGDAGGGSDGGDLGGTGGGLVMR